MQVVHLPGVELCSTPQQDSIQFLEHLLDCMYLVAKSCHFLAKIWLWFKCLGILPILNISISLNIRINWH